MVDDVRQRSERGFILVVSLVILLVLTLLGVTMFRGSGLNEKIAGNMKEKGRALQMAQSALHHAEYLLLTNGAQMATSVSCSGVMTAPAICQAPAVTIQDSATGPSLSNGYVDTNAPGYSSSAYYAAPEFYIRYLGPTASGNGMIYDITALGYGGNPSAVAVVENTYQITSKVIVLNPP